MTTKRSVVKGIGAALAVMGVMGLGGLAQPAKAAEDVTYLLPAPPFLPAFGPWMLAQARGYYAAEGLNVTFQAAKGGVDVAKQVGAGNAPIGGGIGDTPIIVRDNGIPVKAVAVLGGRSMTQIVARSDSGIKGPADLKGKTITALSFQDTTYYALLGALASAGLTKNDVNAQAAGPQGVWQLFIAGKADAMASVPDWIGLARAEGMDLTILPVENYFPSMAQAIIASDELIASNPELIGKLVRATLKGMADIMADPSGAVADYVKAVPQNAGKEAAMEAVFKLYNEYVYPGQAVLGAMDPKRLEAVQAFYVKEGFVKEALPLDNLYTNQFVQ
jgi:NitT/TauT family transport system substrate-binding protein